MSWHYSQALVAEYSAANCSDGEPSAQSSASLTPLLYCAPDRMTAFSRLSRFGMTCAPLTASLGADLLTWYLAASLAKTSAQQEVAQGLTEHDPGFGEKWQELSVRYDPASSSWKTHRSLWDEDLPGCSLTLPTWGLMLNGVLWERRTWEHLTTGKDAGLWPTPRKQMTRPCKPRLNLKNKHKSNLEEVVALEQGADGGRLNPTWVEWLMGWPIKWTDLQPLETDKFQQWLHWHGKP